MLPACLPGSPRRSHPLSSRGNRCDRGSITEARACQRVVVWTAVGFGQEPGRPRKTCRGGIGDAEGPFPEATAAGAAIGWMRWNNYDTAHTLEAAWLSRLLDMQFSVLVMVNDIIRKSASRGQALSSMQLSFLMSRLNQRTRTPSCLQSC